MPSTENLSNEQMLKFLDIEFYQIEDHDGVKYAHINNFAYRADSSPDQNDPGLIYRNVEFTFCNISAEDIANEYDAVSNAELLSKQYAGDYRETDIVRLLRECLEPCRPKLISTLSNNDGEGWYVNISPEDYDKIADGKA